MELLMKIKVILWYHEIEFVISLNQAYFVMSQIRFRDVCDIKNTDFIVKRDVTVITAADQPVP